MSWTDDDHTICEALLAARRAAPVDRERLERDVVVHLQPLTHSLAHRYRHRGVDLDDLEQVADLALLKAMRRFDPACGPLRGYVTATVLGELKRHFRDHAWMIRPPRHIQELQVLVADAVADAGDDHTDRGRIAQVAASLEVPEAVVAEVLVARGGFRCLSLDHRPAPGTPRPFDALTAQDGLAETDRHLFVAALCACLGEDDRTLLRLRFVDELSQSEVAARLGSSQKQVSRALGRVLEELRRRAVDELRDA